MHTTDIPNCMAVPKLQQAMTKDNHLHQLREHIIRGCSQSRNEEPLEIRSYWTFRDDRAVTDGIISKSRQIVIPQKVQKQAIDILHSNHVGIEKIRLLAHESIYKIGKIADTETQIKRYLTCLGFQQLQPKERLIHQNPRQTMGVVSVDIFYPYNKNYFCIVDYHSKIPVIKKMESLSADNLILAC